MKMALFPIPSAETFIGTKYTCIDAAPDIDPYKANVQNGTTKRRRYSLIDLNRCTVSKQAHNK